MKRDAVDALRAHGIQPSAHRVAIAQYVLNTDQHPTAEQVWRQVQLQFPIVSRATVYNTLNLFVEKGLVRELYLAGGVVVFDPNMGSHHHFVDEATGRIYDIPWDAVQVLNAENLDEFETRDFQVVMRGRRRGPQSH